MASVNTLSLFELGVSRIIVVGQNRRNGDQAINYRKRRAACRQIAHSAIIKSVGLIGVVATTLLLWSSPLFQAAPSLYRAKPEDVPLWAEQGNFRFIRLDGGHIESRKAEQTWWGKKFNAEEKDVLTHR